MRSYRLPSLLAHCSPRRCLAVALLALLPGCGRPQAATSSPQAPAAAAPGAAVPVTLVRPEQKALRRVLEQPAHVEAFEETPLFARISGYVQKVYVDIGDRVRGPQVDATGKQLQPGQVLAELWVPEMEEELRQKKALVSQAEAEVDQAAAAVAAAEANIATARAMVLEAEAGRDRVEANHKRWLSEHKRLERMARSVLDQQTLDEAMHQLEAAAAARKEVEARVYSAQATARESEAKRDKARADFAAAQARVRVAQADEGRTAALLAYSKVRAPYDGVISSRNIHTGHYLNGTGSQALFVVERTDTVRVFVDIPEADAIHVTEDVPAHVRIPVIKDQEFDGKVTRSSWSLHDKARTLRTEIDLSNPQGKLRPGMYAYVTFQATLPSTFTLPAAAVTTQGGESWFFRVEHGKAVRTLARLGAREGPLVQVLKKWRSPAGEGQPGAWEDLTGQEEVAIVSSGALAEGQAVVVDKKP